MNLEDVQKVGPYHVIRSLGQGGMGAVFLARHESLEREVALKVLTGDTQRDPTVLARFKREAECAMALNHPGLVKVWDFGADDNLWYLAMELVDGQTLGDVLKEVRPFPVPRALKVTRELLEGLHVCHEAGVIHRDLKPGNVMIDATGRARILDLGLIKQVDRTVLTRENTMVGSPRYMPPEMILDCVSDARSDIYQVGVILYEMAAGHPAFTGDNITELLTAVATKDPEPLELPGADGARVQAFVAKAMARDPADRFRTAAEAIAALSASRAPSGRIARPAASGLHARPSIASTPPPSSNVRAYLIAGGVATAIGGAALWALLSPPPPKPVPSPASIAATPSAPPVSPRQERREMRELVRELSGILVDTVRRELMVELKDYLKSPVLPEDRARDARQWQVRVRRAMDRSGLVELGRRFHEQRDAFLDPVLMPSDRRAVALRRLADLEDFHEGFQHAFGLASGLPVELFRISGVWPEAKRPEGVRPIAAVEFGDGGKSRGRQPLPAEWKPVRVRGNLFNSRAGNWLIENSEGAHHKDKRVKLPIAPGKYREVYVSCRFEGHGVAERVALRVIDPDVRGGLDVANLRCFGSPKVAEPWIRADERLFSGPEVSFAVVHDDYDVKLLPEGMYVDHVVIWGRP